MIDPEVVLNRYSDLSLRDRLHIYGRIKACPWKRILDNLPHGKALVDIGCGHGLFINLIDMYADGFEKLVGIDLAEDKITIAKQTENDQISFHSIRWQDCDERADIFSIIDVFYLMPYDEQEQLIQSIYDRLPNGGFLFLKEMREKPYWKFAINYIEETVMVKLFGFTLGSRFFFRSLHDFESLLKRAGFFVKVIDLQKGYFHPHLLLVCQK